MLPLSRKNGASAFLVPPPSAGRCAIRVGREWRRWAEGACLVFDDSFEHEVVNATDRARVVLLVRFWHPALQHEAQRQRALKYCIGMREQVPKPTHAQKGQCYMDALTFLRLIL